MGLAVFPFLLDNTRLVLHEDCLYKVKVKYNQETFKDVTIHSLTVIQAHREIEQCIKALLYILKTNGTFKPILTPCLVISPRKVSWDFPQKYAQYVFQQNGKVLHALDWLLELRVSYRCDNANNTEPTRSEVMKSGSSDTHDIRKTQRPIHKPVVLPIESLVVNVPYEGTETAIGRFSRSKDGTLRVIAKNKEEQSKSDSGKRINIKHATKAVKPPSRDVPVTSNPKSRKSETEKTQTSPKVRVTTSMGLRRKNKLKERKSIRLLKVNTMRNRKSRLLQFQEERQTDADNSRSKVGNLQSKPKRANTKPRHNHNYANQCNNKAQQSSRKISGRRRKADTESQSDNDDTKQLNGTKQKPSPGKQDRPNNTTYREKNVNKSATKQSFVRPRKPKQTSQYGNQSIESPCGKSKTLDSAIDVVEETNDSKYM